MTHSDCGLLVDKLSWSWPSSEPGWWSSCRVRWAVWCWATCWTTATARRGRPSWRSAQHWRSSRVSTRSNSNVRLESAGKPCPRYWMNTRGKLKLKVMRSYYLLSQSWEQDCQAGQQDLGPGDQWAGVQDSPPTSRYHWGQTGQPWYHQK